MMKVRGLTALAAMTVVLVFASAAQAASSWSSGLIEKSHITNCPSIIFGDPYIEEGAWTWTGQYLDPANPPDVGQTFYVDVVAGAVGNSCSGQRVHFEILGLPVSGMATAITGGTPVICWAINWNTSPASAVQEPPPPAGACPQAPQAGIFNATGASFDAVDSSGNNPAPWPLPQGRGWEIQIPVTVDHALHGGFGYCNDCNAFDTFVLDGNSSPHLYPHQGLFVDAPGVNPGGGGGPGGTAGGTSQGLTANPQKPPPAAAPTGKRAAALKKCKKKKGSARKKCKKKALKLPV
ncbi:MAG: hypothetical protein QOD60_2448 [Solirubrobacterales bacterium]|jgi:hypothetical protein|nr:hypothetical protein [Solirubrobacterales bacterium]